MKRINHMTVWVLMMGLLFCGARMRAAGQYKKVSREAMVDIVDGRYSDAIDGALRYLEANASDLESMYVLAVAHANQGQIDAAMQYVTRAVNGGMPLGRFLAGPRDLLEPLTSSEQFKLLRRNHPVQLLHGPMIGCLTDHSAKFWVRTAEQVRVNVRVRPTDSEGRLAVATGHTSEKQDYTAILAVDGLRADTRYAYELLVQGDSEAVKGVFRTAPRAHEPATFTIGFGGGAGFTPQYERMWNTINGRDPLAFLFLGDNVYIDNPTRPAVQQYCYYRRQSRPEYRKFIGSTGIYAIWDDHDFTTNDAGGGPEIRRPEWKIPVWHVFKQNWVNPSYAGDSEDQPGCWFDFYIADVHFIMLDCRYYRTKARVEHPSMLGPVQLDWLFETLKSSKGNLIVLASSVPWAYGAKPGSLDPWQGYKEERRKIFSFLSDNRIEGVVLISADRHRSDLWKIERPDGYPLYEFESSKLTNIHTHGIMKGSIFGYNDKCSFARLEFNTTLSDPELTYTIISIDDEVIHDFTVKKSHLCHK